MGKDVIVAISQKEQLKEYWKELVAEEGLSDNRHQRNVMYRHAFLVVCREVSTLSITEIGEIIGKHHATVIHATKNHESNMRFNNIYRSAYTRIASMLGDMMVLDLDFEEFYGIKDENKKLRTRLMELSKRNRQLIVSKVNAEKRLMEAESLVEELNKKIHDQQIRINNLNKKLAAIAW